MIAIGPAWNRVLLRNWRGSITGRFMSGQWINATLGTLGQPRIMQFALRYAF